MGKSNNATTATPMGSIISAVAVLETHIEIIAVASMHPSSS
jgi:hypothetical protein